MSKRVHQSPPRSGKDVDGLRTYSRMASQLVDSLSQGQQRFQSQIADYEQGPMTIIEQESSNNLMEHVQKRLLQLKKELHERQVALEARGDLLKTPTQSVAAATPVSAAATPKTMYHAASAASTQPSFEGNPMAGAGGNQLPGADLWPYWSCLTTPADNFGEPLAADKQAHSRAVLVGLATPTDSFVAEKPTQWSDLTPRVSNVPTAVPTGLNSQASHAATVQSSPAQAQPLLSSMSASTEPPSGAASYSAPNSSSFSLGTPLPKSLSMSATAGLRSPHPRGGRVSLVPPPQAVARSPVSRDVSLQSSKERISMRVRDRSSFSTGRETNTPMKSRGSLNFSREPALRRHGAEKVMPQVQLFQQVPTGTPVDNRSLSPMQGFHRGSEQVPGMMSPTPSRFSAVSPQRSVSRRAVSPGKRFIQVRAATPAQQLSATPAQQFGGMPHVPLAVPVLPPTAKPVMIAADGSEVPVAVPAMPPTAMPVMSAADGTEAQPVVNLPRAMSYVSQPQRELPEPEEVARQKQNHEREIMSKLKQDESKLEEMQEKARAELKARAEESKQKYESLMDQKVQNEEVALTQKFKEQVMRLTQQAQARRAELERAAFNATLEWQQKKVEDMYLAQQSHMEQEYREAQEKIAAEIQKLASQRTSPSLLGGAGLEPPPHFPLGNSGLLGSTPFAVPSFSSFNERLSLGSSAAKINAASATGSRVATPGHRLRGSTTSPTHSFVASPMGESRPLQLSESLHGTTFMRPSGDVSPRAKPSPRS